MNEKKYVVAECVSIVEFMRVMKEAYQEMVDYENSLKGKPTPPL